MVADGRSARTSAQVAARTATDPDARSARASAQVAARTATYPTGRVARVSVQVAIFAPIEPATGGGWGTIYMGIG